MTAWGEELDPSKHEGSCSCPIRFPGQYADPETGFYYNLNRYYDPSTGRYTTPDPVGLVILETAFGGSRVVDMLAGDPLPRIC